MLMLLELGDQRADVGDRLVDRLPHGLGGAELRLLREVADADARVLDALAEELLVDAGHDAKQRALARAVGADHADLRAGKERQIDVLEDALVRRVDARDLLHGEDELWHGIALARAAAVSREWFDFVRHRADAAAARPPRLVGLRRLGRETSREEQHVALGAPMRIKIAAFGYRARDRSARTRAARATPHCP